MAEKKAENKVGGKNKWKLNGYIFKIFLCVKWFVHNLFL